MSNGTRKRVVRQRLWGGDDAVTGRSIGESLRNVDSAVVDQPPMRIVAWENQVYPSDGLQFFATTAPLGALIICAQLVDGTTPAGVGAIPDVKQRGRGEAVAKIGGLAVGTRYAVIRMLVVG